MQAQEFIDAISKANVKTIPAWGLAPTDPDGKLKPVNAKYHSHDGQIFDAVIERDYEITVDHERQPGIYEKRSFIAVDLRVCFLNKDKENWKPVRGVCLFKDLRSTFKRHFYEPYEAPKDPVKEPIKEKVK